MCPPSAWQQARPRGRHNLEVITGVDGEGEASRVQLPHSRVCGAETEGELWEPAAEPSLGCPRSCLSTAPWVLRTRGEEDAAPRQGRGEASGACSGSLEPLTLPCSGQTETQMGSASSLAFGPLSVEERRASRGRDGRSPAGPGREFRRRNLREFPKAPNR